ncbi:MAG: agmatine deiminase family protein [Planctomycetota bacterium]
MPTRRSFLGTTALAIAAGDLVGCARSDEQPAGHGDERQGRPQGVLGRGGSVAYAASLYEETDAELLVDSTPADDGYYFPAEWEPHEATLMVMPPPQNWAGAGFKLADVRQQWADVANVIAEYEPVRMVVAPGQAAESRRVLSREIDLIELPVNDGWSRDTGPMVVVNGRGDRRVAGFTFNGWGQKFPPYSSDMLLKARLADRFKMPMYPVDLVTEGGAILVDGDGTAVVTAQCLLHPNRNPGYTREQVDTLLNNALGTDKVIWVEKGLTPDPITDGHIDGLAAFAEPGVILLHSCDLRSDPNHKICQSAKQVLEQTTDAKGRMLEIIEVPLADDVVHMNFYICNGAVVVPIAEDQGQDDTPLGIYREVFPDHEVVGVGGTVLSEGGGGIHCITQQVPAI